MIIDLRYAELATLLTSFSTELRKGERVLIDAYDVPDAMVIALLRAARARGAHPYVQLHRARITRELGGAVRAACPCREAAHGGHGRLYCAARGG